MSSCSDDLLATLVTSIRQACEQNITFDNFTSVSGLICFDIDGFKQKSFVISELLKKKSLGEGNSSHLKTLNWRGVERKEIDGLQESRDSLTKPSLVAGSKGSHVLDGQTTLHKGPNSPHSSFAILNTKFDWCNRTFTLEPKSSNEVESAAKYSLEETNKTITPPNDASSEEKQSNLQFGDKGDVHLGPGKYSSVCDKRWLKSSKSPKVKTNYRNCYPNLPKKPLKRCQSPHNFKTSKQERPTTKHSKEYISESLRESDHYDNLQHMKALYNSPAEKPTALSWYETSIAPSNSFESIESIQPFYLVPHSEPLSYPEYYKNENENISKDPGYNHHRQNITHTIQYTNVALSLKETGPTLPRTTTFTSQFSQDARGDPYLPFSPLNQESPVKTIVAHSTASNVTPNTTCSMIEPDVLTVKEGKLQKSLEMEGQTVKPSHLSGAHDVLSDCSATSKKRASLMKWMGLFKKGSKTSTNETNEKQKQMTKLKSGKTIPEPPMEIRVKQWN